MMQKINDFLDRDILPWPVRYLSHRFIILLTISLLIPLVVFASNQTLVLMINSYLNTMSVAVSSIVLLYATLSEAHQKQLAEMQEKRAQEDHSHVTEMHTLMLQALANQHEEIEDLKEMMATTQGKTYERKEAQRLQDLRELHPRGGARFEADDTHKRLAGHLHRHHLADSVRQDFIPPASTQPQPQPTPQN